MNEYRFVFIYIFKKK